MTKHPPKDQAARTSVIEKLGTSFAIEAGAGTGKTTLLTARIIEALRTGHARLSEIAAITFTDRAANELKVKLRDELERLAAETAGAEHERLTEALAELDAAHTSTIHSFCAELLRERPVEAGVDPGFEIADALRASLLFDEVWARWIKTQLDDADGPLRPALLAELSIENIRDFARFLRDNQDLSPAEAECEARIEPLIAPFIDEATRLAKRIRPKCPSPACSCRTRIEKAATAAEELAAAPPDEQLARLPSIAELGIERPVKTCKEHKEECTRAVNDLEAKAARLRSLAGHRIVCGLAALLRGLVGEYEREKRKRAWLDFNDLLLRARDLLRNDKDVRGYFQGRFKMILVDECQDTDPLQTEIALFLAEDGAKANDWSRVRIAPGKLLFVGDPKQSVYRFRRADIEIYEEAKQAVGKTGQLVQISQNFRSSASCVAWVNAVFNHLIVKPEDGAYQPEYVPLHADRTDAAPAVTILRPPENVEFGKIDEARSAEAPAVAAEIQRSIGRGDTVYDKAAKTMRPVTYGDFAILFRTRTSFGAYENALAAFGIPYRAMSGRAFFARQEVSELRQVLAAVERPYNQLAVVGALRTSLLGISDDELAASAGGGFNYLAQAAPSPEPIRGAFELLARWHDARISMSHSALVQQVLSETKALELFYLKPGGEQRAANLTKVIDLARDYEQTPGATFGKFVRWLEELSTAGDEGESALADETGEFVKLITIHQAKGLEFPVVVLADLAGERKKRAEPALHRRTGCFDIQLGAAERGIRTLGYAQAAEHEAKRLEAEARRLFYVAATRARDRLILPYFVPGGEEALKTNCTLKYLLELPDSVAAAAKALSVEVAAQPDDLKARDARAFRVNLAGPPPGDCDALIAERERWSIERAKLIEAASAGKRLRTPSGLNVAEPTGFGAPSEASSVSSAIGIAEHGVLEQTDLRSTAHLGRLAEEEAARNGVARERPLIERLAKNALASPVVCRAAKADRVYREVPFAVSVGGTILEGVINLAFDDGEGLVLVDYKTDDVSEDQLAAHTEHYRLQVGAYALAAREVFGRLPRAASLLFLRLRREVSVTIDEALIQTVMGAL